MPPDNNRLAKVVFFIYTTKKYNDVLTRKYNTNPYKL